MSSIKWQDVGSCSALPRALNNHSRPSSKAAGIGKIQANPSQRHKPSTPGSEFHCSSRAMAESTEHNAQLGLQADRHRQKTRESRMPPGRLLTTHCAPCLLRGIESQAASEHHHHSAHNSEAKLRACDCTLDTTRLARDLGFIFPRVHADVLGGEAD